MIRNIVGIIGKVTDKVLMGIGRAVNAATSFVCDKAIGSAAKDTANMYVITNSEVVSKVFDIIAWINIAIMVLVTAQFLLNLWVNFNYPALIWTEGNQGTIKQTLDKCLGKEPIS